MANNIEKEKISAVIVTYNRKKLLKECLNGVLTQAYPVNKIFIVDNASTDGTEEFLRDSHFFKNEKIRYIKLLKNIGPAGGFHEGVKNACKEEFDWLWLMDDDVRPEQDGLEKLLKYEKISHCIHGRIVYSDKTPVVWADYIDIKSGKVFNNEKFWIDNKNCKKFMTINFGCFEGMLIRKDVVEKIGFPDERFFFIGVDTVYGLLASLYTNVLYVDEIIFKKMIRSGGTYKKILGRESARVNEERLYYSVRNKFLVEKYFQLVFGDEAGLNINHSIFILVQILRIIAGIFIYDNYKIRRILIVLRGMRDGYKLSKNFDLPIKLQ